MEVKFGAHLIHRQPNLNDRQITLDHIFNNLMCEKLHIKFGKFILGVHRKTTNQAVLSEIGRFPIYFDIIKSM